MIKMSQERKDFIKSCYPKIKELHEKGVLLKDIAAILDININTVHYAITAMGLPRRRNVVDESKLLYANNRIFLKRVIINGKKYTDVTPLLVRR